MDELQIPVSIIFKIRDFADGKISLAQWLDLTRMERSTLAGALIGNFAAHHAEEAYRLLCELRDHNEKWRTNWKSGGM